MKLCVQEMKLKPATLAVIAKANTIIEEYQRAGYKLTLRQLYYQFVSRDWLPNNQKEYSRLGDIVSNGRRVGLIDWDAIEDRTRGLKGWSSWDSPSQIITGAAYSYRVDLWEHQPGYVEVWFEKDALAGVFERACSKRRVPYFSCRGYASDSELFVAAERMKRRAGRKTCTVLHFGDHDPSGIDMTRDITDRLHLFGARRVTVERLALNMDQIEKYRPPPNPAKETDSRFADYLAKFGDESWELDALEPRVLSALVESNVQRVVDETQWRSDLEREETEKAALKRMATHYDKLAKLVSGRMSIAELNTLHNTFTSSDDEDVEDEFTDQSDDDNHDNDDDDEENEDN